MSDNSLSLPPADRDSEERLAWEERRGEEAYAKMYETPAGAGLAGLYSDVKDHLGEAAGIARRLGKTDDAKRLSDRLAEIKETFRKQFPG